MDQAHGSVSKGPVMTGPAIVETIVVAPQSGAQPDEFRFAWHFGFWALILAATILFIWLLSGILLPFAAGIALGYLLDPVSDRLRRVAFYMLLDGDRMIATLDTLIPPRNRADVHAIAHEIDRALAGFVRGQSLVCLFLGLWYGIGLSLIHLNFGLLIGLSAGLLSFIPYVGSLTALILSSIVAIVQGWPEWKLLILTLAVVLTGQFLEGYMLSPKLVGSSVGLHPVWVIFALLAFGSLFGFTGLIMAVPVAAAAGVVLRYLVRRYRASELYLGRAETGGPLPHSI